MKKVGIIGWRGMVGSVLKARMMQEADFNLITPYFFSTSQVGQPAPKVHSSHQLELTLRDAYSFEQLREMDIIITTQGSGYTEQIHPELRKSGWQGYWIDAASSLRMKPEGVLILDPVNARLIQTEMEQGKKDYIGSNCTVSIMLMAIGGLFLENQVEWVSSMSYQAASGAGAEAMKELIAQMAHLTDIERKTSDKNILHLEQTLTRAMNRSDFPQAQFGYALAGGLLPWIDKAVADGQSKEEWKGMVEANKILGTENIPVDGTCVRIGSMRCHSMGFTVKLKQNLSIKDIEAMISQTGEWVQVIPNDKESSLSQLTPAKVSGSLKIPVGRLRKMNLGNQYLNAFTVGDQLLWGAAEPLRRMLRIILNA